MGAAKIVTDAQNSANTVAIDVPRPAYAAAIANDTRRSAQWAFNSFNVEQTSTKATVQGQTIAVIDTGVKARIPI